MTFTSRIPHDATPREAAEATIDYLRWQQGVQFAGPSQGALSILFLRALAGEWLDNVPLIGQPHIAPEHLIDHLARHHLLIPEEVTCLGDPLAVCAVVDELPTCGGCAGSAARFDAWATRSGPAMLLCTTCASPYLGRTLGLGSVTYLLTYDEVHWSIRDICDQVTAELGRESIWSNRSRPGSVRE